MSFTTRRSLPDRQLSNQSRFLIHELNDRNLTQLQTLKTPEAQTMLKSSAIKTFVSSIFASSSVAAIVSKSTKSKTASKKPQIRRRRLLRARGERRRLDCIQFTFHSSHNCIMAWAAIGWNYKSPLYFISYEGEGKGFTQEKYA